MASRNTPTEWMFARYGARWGLRGDPVLWAWMEASFAAEGLPEDEGTFEARLKALFADMTGHPLGTAPDKFGVESLRRKEGGMSNGMISSNTWRKRLIPLLITRHRQFAASQSDLAALPAIEPDSALVPRAQE